MWHADTTRAAMQSNALKFHILSIFDRHNTFINVAQVDAVVHEPREYSLGSAVTF